MIGGSNSFQLPVRSEVETLGTAHWSITGRIPGLGDNFHDKKAVDQSP